MEYKNISSDLSLRSAATWTGDTVIRGCVSFIQNGQTHVEEASEHDAEFWGVYLPQNDGRTMWYSDHDTKAQAEAMTENLKSIGPVDMEQLFQVSGSEFNFVVDSKSGKIIQELSLSISESTNSNLTVDTTGEDYLIQLAAEFAGKTTTKEKFCNVMMTKFSSEHITDKQREMLFGALSLTKGKSITEFKNALNTYWSGYTQERKKNRDIHRSAVAESKMRQFISEALKAASEFNVMCDITEKTPNKNEFATSYNRSGIDHFDVIEALSWVKSYQANELKKLAGEHFDILAVGYWNKDGSYTEPESEYRQEIVDRYWQNQSPFLVLITDQDNEVIATLNTHFNQNSTLSFEPKRPGELPVSDDAFSGLCYSMQTEVNDALQNGGTFILTENGDWQWPHEAENKALPEYSFRVAVDDSLPLNQAQESFVAERDIPTLEDVQYQLNGSGLKYS